MTIVVTHTTPADSSFSTEGAAAWNANHALSGVGTMAEQDADNVAITGGSINGASIGAAAPGAATFTTLTATGQTSLASSSGNVRVGSGTATEKLDVSGGGLVIRGTANQVNGNAGLYADLSGSTTRFTAINPNVQWLNMSFAANQFSFLPQNAEQFRISHTASAVNYVQVTGAATGGNPIISAQGSDANRGLNLTTKGTGFFNFYSQNGANFQFRIDSTNTAVNYLQVAGTAAGVAPILSAQGTDTNIGLNLTTKGTGSIDLNTGNGTGFRVIDAGVGSAIPVVAKAGPTTSALFPASGNTELALSSSGTAAVRILTNTIGQEQFRVSHTASAVNYVQVTGAATGSAPIIGPQGSDANITLGIQSKGSGAIRFDAGGSANFRVLSNSSAVNRIDVTGSASGFAPSFTTSGSDTNIDLALTTKGTGAVKVNTGTGEMVRIADSAGTGFVQLGGGTNPYIVSQGSTNASFSLASNGTGTVWLRTNGGGTTQAAVAHTASAVNYVQVTGAATGAPVAISAQGSDSNIRMNLFSKGTESVDILTSGGAVRQARFTNTASTANWVQMTGAAAGSSPVYTVAGSDTNIDLALTPKGTGLVRFGTYTAGAPTATGYISIKAADGTTYKVLVGT